MASLLTLVSLIALAGGSSPAGRFNNEASSGKYLLYSWDTMWSGDPACGLQQLEEWDEKGSCFTKTWDTAAKRRKLWCVCNRPEREVGSLLLYGIAQITKAAMELGTDGCHSEGIAYVRETIAEGHSHVPFLKIFALVSEGGEAVPEQELVPGIVWYNAECAATEREKIDGVAVNNEDFTTILQEHGSEQRKVAYLTNLAKIGAKAGDGLLTHFSISWNWFEAGDVTFNGVRKNAVKHMIDLFNSTDLQTAYILGSVMLDRMQKGFHGTAASAPDVGGDNYFTYSKANGKETFFTLYLSKTLPCQTTFFPRAECDGQMGWDVVSYQTEAKMWEEVEVVTSSLDTQPSLHYYGGVYSSGAHPDWPDFCPNTAPGCNVNKIPYKKVIARTKRVATWTDCRDMCNNTEECEYFKWRDNAILRRRLCLLQKVDYRDADGWVSGQQFCS